VSYGSSVARALALVVVLTSCNGSTGGDLFEFDAYASGPEGAANGTYTFVTDRGYEVTLTRATLHIGALYLNQSVPTSVSSDTSCILPGIYVAEVTSGLEVDALDATPRRFPSRGFASSDRARTAEVWLSGGDLFAETDPTAIAIIEGTATKGGETHPFSAHLTISDNRKVAASDPALPGAKPICKERVVTPIRVDTAPEPGGSLLVRVDPAGWFGNVEFEELELGADGYRFRDDDGDQPSRALYAGIRSNAGVYEIEWISNSLETP
jgi:hypothetical protein